MVVPGAGRFLRNVQRNLSGVSAPNPGCTVIAKTSVYFGADSDFVSDADAECDFCTMENGNKAAAAIQAIFVAVRDVYLRDVCVDVSVILCQNHQVL